MHVSTDCTVQPVDGRPWIKAILDQFVTVQCTECDAMHTIRVPRWHIQRWLDGMVAQRALPSLSPAGREWLISGLCEPCFDSIIPED